MNAAARLLATLASLFALQAPALAASYAFAGGEGFDLADELRTERCIIPNTPAGLRVIVATQHGSRLVGCYAVKGSRVVGVWLNGRGLDMPYYVFRVQPEFKGVPLNRVSDAYVEED